MRHTLGVDTFGVDKNWKVACQAKHGDLLMAGVLGPKYLEDSPRIAVAVVHAGAVARGSWDLKGPEEKQIHDIPAAEWGVSVGVQTMGAERWIRVDVVGRGGEDLVMAQGVVSFFAVAGEQLKHLWTGLGDRAETRFDACQMHTVTRFQLLAGRTLARRWRSSATFRDPGGTSEELIKSLKNECVAHPATVQKFPLPPEPPTGG